MNREKGPDGGHLEVLGDGCCTASTRRGRYAGRHDDALACDRKLAHASVSPQWTSTGLTFNRATIRKGSTWRFCQESRSGSAGGRTWNRLGRESFKKDRL